MTAAVHLNSPEYYTAQQGKVRIETLSDGRLAALFDDDVAGYDLAEYTDPEGMRTCSISCYRTAWYRLFDKKSEKAAVIGRTEDIDYVWCYPGEQGDLLLYHKGEAPSYGVQTLPRLLYRYWLLIGTALTFLMSVVFLLLKHRGKVRLPLKAVLLPLSFTLALLLILILSGSGIYDAEYYLSGILLLTLFIWLFMCSLLDLKKGSTTAGNG